jgi:hypothetical protein
MGYRSTCCINIVIDTQALPWHTRRRKKQLLIFFYKSEELYDRIRSAISRFAELLDSGTEIHPASNAPEKVRRLFPNLKKLTGTPSQVKLVFEAA